MLQDTENNCVFLWRREGTLIEVRKKQVARYGDKLRSTHLRRRIEYRPDLEF